VKNPGIADATDLPNMDSPEKLKNFRFFVASLASLVLVGYVDYITGYELYMDVFYFIPVSICAWQLRRRDVMVVTILCALTWGCVDLYAGHPYSSRFYWYWNIFIKFISLLILGLVVQSLRQNLKEQARARQELEKALAELQQSSAETVDNVRSIFTGSFARQTHPRHVTRSHEPVRQGNRGGKQTRRNVKRRKKKSRSNAPNLSQS
jgi:hypothetical protein